MVNPFHSPKSPQFFDVMLTNRTQEQVCYSGSSAGKFITPAITYNTVPPSVALTIEPGCLLVRLDYSPIADTPYSGLHGRENRSYWRR